MTSGVEGLVSPGSIMHLVQVAEPSKNTSSAEWASVQPVISGKGSIPSSSLSLAWKAGFSILDYEIGFWSCILLPISTEDCYSPLIHPHNSDSMLLLVLAYDKMLH